MMNNDQVKAMLHNPGQAERQIEHKDEYLSAFQRELIGYQKCYENKQFDELTRKYPWGAQERSGRVKLGRNDWIPRYLLSTGKDLVETHVSYLTGRDKFPAIQVTSTDPLYETLDLPEGFEDDAEAGQAKAQENALQAWASAVLMQAKIQLRLTSAIRQALIKRESPVLIRLFGGRARYTVPDRTWCSWGYKESEPDELAWYKERYVFSKPQEKASPNKKDQLYIFERIIDDLIWLDQEYEIRKVDNKSVISDPVVLYEEHHGLGFCPVVIFPDDEDCIHSVYEKGVAENIKDHTEWYNDIRCGVSDEMKPQWVVLRDEATEPSPMGRPGDDDEDLPRGELWELEGRSVQSFSNGTEGFRIASELHEKENTAIRRSANIVDIPADIEMSGRALALLLGPQIAAVDRYRGAIGDAIASLVRKTLMAARIYAASIKLPAGVTAPNGSLENISISLDWGDFMPDTPDVIAEHLDNVERALDLDQMSLHTSQAQTLPMLGVDDVESERRRINREKEEAMQSQLALADAAFKQIKDEDEDE